MQFNRKNLDFSGIWTQIVSLEGEHADHGRLSNGVYKVSTTDKFALSLAGYIDDVTRNRDDITSWKRTA